MSLEIIYYRKTTDWSQIDDLSCDEEFKSYIQPSYPLIVSSVSNRTISGILDSYDTYKEGKTRGRPSAVLASLPASVITYLASKMELTGLNYQINSSCSTSLYAFFQAQLISRELGTPVIVWCAENMNTGFDHWRFNSLGAMDMESGRAFDDSSNGFRMGTGIALYLVKDSSVKHHLPSIATFTKFAFHTNNFLMTNPGNIDEIINGIGPMNYDKVDLWNAHATGTPVGDRAEYEFFSKMITRPDVPIIGYKSYIGHTITASGGMEIAMALEDRDNGFLRPNIIKGNKIIDDPRIITEPVKWTFKKMLKTNLGFGGKTAVCEIDFE